MATITPFREAAEEAAATERAGNYKHAASLWLDAKGKTCSYSNHRWCDHRADNCRSLHKLRKETRRGNK